MKSFSISSVPSPILNPWTSTSCWKPIPPMGDAAASQISFDSRWHGSIPPLRIESVRTQILEPQGKDLLSPAPLLCGGRDHSVLYRLNDRMLPITFPRQPEQRRMSVPAG